MAGSFNDRSGFADPGVRNDPNTTALSLIAPTHLKDILFPFASN